MIKIFSNKNFVYFLLILIGTFVLFRPPVDPDFGWHYKYGEYIFQNRKILKENTFSYTYTDYNWANSYWVSQIIMYVSHHYLGNVWSTIILSIILSLFILIILKKTTNNLVILSFLHIYLAVILGEFLVTVRPLYYSSIFLLFLTYVLLENKKLVNYLPILFALWANMHADFVLGLFFLGIYSLDNFLKITGFPKINIKKSFLSRINKRGFWKILKNISLWFTKTIKNKETPKYFFNSFKVLAISLLVTLINPYGINLWTTLLKELNSPFKSYIAEWGIGIKMDVSSFILSIFLSLGLISGVTSKEFSKNKYKAWYVFLIVFFFIFLLKAMYFVRIFVIISIFAVSFNLDSLRKDLSRIINKQTKDIFKKLYPSFLFFLCFAISPKFLNNLEYSATVEMWSKYKDYPWEAVRFIKVNQPKGNMLNEYVWGGYLIWQLPEYKTFIDGRMASWRHKDNYFMEDYRQIYTYTDDNNNILDKYIEDYKIEWVINKPDSKIIKYLKEKDESTWKTVYEDDISVILQVD